MNYREEVRKIALKHNIHFFDWGISGGNNYICFKQEDEQCFRVLIKINDSFEIFNLIKDEVVDFFESANIILQERQGNTDSWGYKEVFIFNDKESVEAQELAKKELSTTSIGTQINGDVSVGRDLNSGNDIQTTNNDNKDEKWFKKEIVKMILSFICGVAITIVAQLLLKHFNII